VVTYETKFFAIILKLFQRFGSYRCEIKRWNNFKIISKRLWDLTAIPKPSAVFRGSYF